MNLIDETEAPMHARWKWKNKEFGEMPILKTCLLEYMEDTLRKVEVKINSARKYLGNMHTK